MLPGPSVTPGNITPMALMADDGEEEPPWRRGVGSSSSSSRPGPYSDSGISNRFHRSSYGTRTVPGVPGATEESTTVPYGGLRQHQVVGALNRVPLEDDAEDPAEEAEVEVEVEVEPEEDIEPGDSPFSPEGAAPEGEEEEREDIDISPFSDEERSTDADDYWTLGHNWLIRHHVKPRNYLYVPTGARLDLPVSRNRLKSTRRTNKVYEDGSRETVSDDWIVAMMDGQDNLEMFTRTYRRVRRFPMTPADYALVRRVTVNKDTGEVLADEGREELSDLDHCTRVIPGGATNLKVSYYYVPDTMEDKSWTGTTVFELRPLDEELRAEPCKWEPEDPKKVMTKGQKKQLTGEVSKMEYEDVALWSTLMRAQPPVPRGWRLIFELFCGCALLTRMAQSQGYETCPALDIQNGWDVFRRDHRLYAEQVLEEQRPYLLALGFTCGPWSPWQRMCQDMEKVNQKRQKWLPILRWIRQLARKQMARGGRVLLENPWMSEAWNTRELSELEAEAYSENDFYEVIRVDLCQLGLKDRENKLPHLKPTGLGTNSPGIKKVMAGKRCRRDHVHQPLEGSNQYGRRTLQAARWTNAFCRAVLKGILLDLQGLLQVAFSGEAVIEELEETPGFLDAIHGPEGLEKEVELHEGMDAIERETDPEAEKLRRREWLKISKEERIGIRRLHHMTSHASKPQLQRMLRYAGAAPKVVGAVKYFRCGICERESEEKKPFPVKPPSPYTFNSTVGLDIFEVKDAAEVRYQVLHAVCHGTTYQCGEVLGVAKGVPASSQCLQAFLRFWCVWAGPPNCIVVDRGLHNRGIFQSELEKAGVTFRYAATEAPWELGRTERHGGLLKGIMSRTILAEQIAGLDGLQIVLVESLNTKNRLGNAGGFSPQQWVLGRHPKMEGWPDEDVPEIPVVDEDPMSTFNRRAAVREAARLAWMQEDSQKRIRKAILRQGGSDHQRYRTGDLVNFQRKRGGRPRWYGPARVLVQDEKNVWILHGGVPVVTSTAMVRPSCPEELLEYELLGRRSKGVKRLRGFGYDDVVRSHQMDTQQQQSYMDFRKVERDDMEDDLAQEFRLPYSIPATVPPTEAGGDEESPKRMRQLEKEPIETENEQRPEQVPVPDGDDSISPSTPHSVSPTGTFPAVPIQDTELQRALRDPDRLDGGPQRARTLQIQREMDEALELLLPVLHGEEDRDRSRSPHREGRDRVVNHVVRKEFNCFMVNRSGAKAKAKSRGAQEIIYRKESEEMQRKLDEARGREWSNWVKYKATRQPTTKEVEMLLRKGYKAIPMRWVDIDKNSKLRVPGGPPVEEKLKSRLVMRGDLEEGDFRVDCPTSTQVGVHMLLSYAACTGQALRSGDITSAFLQGAPIDRTLLMKVPHDRIPNENGVGYSHPPGSYLIALMSIYGSRDAPRGFWLALRDELVRQGFHEIEPAMYSLVKDGQFRGLATTHVDDVLWCGDEELQKAMEKVQQRFTFGSTECLGEGEEGSFRFCGRKIQDHGNYISITTPEILQKVKSIHVGEERKREPSAEATAEEQSQMRAVLGSLGWVARLCRPELSYKCSALQGKQSKPCVRDLIDTNKFLAAAQRTSQNGVNFWKGTCDFHQACLLSVTDASHAAEVHMSEIGKPMGHRSQAGRFLLIGNHMVSDVEECNFHILEWNSHALRRVCRSTLQAETLSSMEGSELGNYVRYLMYAMKYPKERDGERLRLWKIAAMDEMDLHLVSDCRSLITYLGNPVQNTVAAKRLAIDLTAMRQDLWRARGSELGEPGIQSEMPTDGTDHLWWISTKDMLSDGLTKQMLWTVIREVAEKGRWKLTSPSIRAGINTGSVKNDGCEDE